MTAAEHQRLRKMAAHATEIRMAKANLKAELRLLPAHESLAQVADLIENRGMFDVATPWELIRSCRNVGKAKADDIVSSANVKRDVRLRDIAPERRKAIAFDCRRLAAQRKRLLNGGPPETDEIGPDD